MMDDPKAPQWLPVLPPHLTERDYLLGTPAFRAWEAQGQCQAIEGLAELGRQARQRCPAPREAQRNWTEKFFGNFFRWTL